MRDIRFRGKRIDNGEWVYGSLIDYSIVEAIPNPKLTILHESGSSQVDPETVGQFTGLHDREGKEIWEGDLILSSNGYKHMDKTTPVEWDKAKSSWKVGEAVSWNDGTTTSHAVIGTIHDKGDTEG